MRGLKRTFLLLLTLTWIVTSLSSTGWAAGNDTLGKNDPVAHEWNALDVLLARPIAVIAGIAGSAVFVASLPFTIPTGAVRDAADIFIVRPFQFSFVRQFPDEDI